MVTVVFIEFTAAHGTLGRMPIPRTRIPRPRSLATQLFAMQVAVVTVLVIGCAALAYGYAEAQTEEAARDLVAATARTVADSPQVREAVRGPDPTAALQPYALRVTKDAGVAFVTIMNPAGIRWTHPDPSQIGRRFLGDTAPALRGETFTETFTGTLGASVRVVTPVEYDGRVVALVSVGITVSTIDGEVRGHLAALIAAAVGALAAGGAGSYAVNRRLRRHTHGMDADDLSRMYDYHEATLHAVREGLILLDARHEVALCNDAARELLDLPADVTGHRVDALGLPDSLTDSLLAEEPRADELHLTPRRIVVVSTRPVHGGEHRGTVVTLRDHTELQALTGELDSERGFTEALRSQAHEAANRLHTVVSLIALGRVDDAVEFATAELQLAQTLTDQVVAACAEPVLAALLLGKAAQASERGVDFKVTDDSRIDDGVLPAHLSRRDLVTILGNLIDNALDAAVAACARTVTPYIEVTARVNDGELLLRVADSGPGVDQGAVTEVFRRGWSTKLSTGKDGRGLGLALVEQAVRRCGGTVRVDREVGAVFTVTLPARKEAGA